jgi:DNA-binding transcriptional MerR regulator
MAIPTEWTKRYYSIGDAANTFDLLPSTLRFWEKQFPQLKPKKSTKGQRKYTAKDMDILRRIYHLVKERGFTIEGAIKKFNSNVDDVANNEEVVRRLMQVRLDMQSLRQQIEKLP